MNLTTAAGKKNCPKSEIAAYIDGELSLRQELELEMHFTGCQNCRTRLNEQKAVVCALDFVLENDGKIELPANFTKVVVVKAESSVSGLRRPQERAKALLVCAALFLVVIFGLGSETETIFDVFWKFSEQILVVGGFVFHLFYDISVGIAIILRSLSQQFVFNSTVSTAVVAVFFVISVIGLSRLIVHHRP